jgi:hypothetical protein
MRGIAGLAYRRASRCGHYTKLAILAFRVFGLIVLSYAIPILLYGVVRVANGSAVAARNPDESTFLGWLIYGLAGLLLLLLAKPLGRIAARGFDVPASASPAA